MNILILSENDISEYDCAILYYALAYNIDPTFQISDEDIMGLSDMLSVNFDLLNKALKTELDHTDVIQIGQCGICLHQFNNTELPSTLNNIVRISLYDSVIFYMFFAIYQSYTLLDNLSDCTTLAALDNNIKKLKAVEFFFESINGRMGSFENLKLPEFAFDYKYCMYDEKESSQNTLIKHLEFRMLRDRSSLDLDYCNTLCQVVSYELKNRISEMNLVVVLQAIKHSQLFSPNIKDMADEFYNYLIDLFRNGRVISMRINSLYCDANLPIATRTKSTNTTRIQILYGFSNYDDYELRFDFAHGTISYPHFNNLSQGKTTASLFNKKQYEQIIKEYPDFKDFFIKYPLVESEDDIEADYIAIWHSYQTRSVYALKEKKNCVLSVEQSKIYDTICSKTDHAPIFSKCYAESEIENFISAMSKMLSNKLYRPIDINRTHAINCFVLDKLICIIRKLCLFYELAQIKGETDGLDEAFEKVGEFSFANNLISSSEITNVKTFAEIYYIIMEATERIL